MLFSTSAKGYRDGTCLLYYAKVQCASCMIFLLSVFRYVVSCELKMSAVIDITLRLLRLHFFVFRKGYQWGNSVTFRVIGLSNSIRWWRRSTCQVENSPWLLSRLSNSRGKSLSKESRWSAHLMSLAAMLLCRPNSIAVKFPEDCLLSKAPLTGIDDAFLLIGFVMLHIENFDFDGRNWGVYFCWKVNLASPKMVWGRTGDVCKS